jgi:di/tricarboxylate transporter
LSLEVSIHLTTEIAITLGILLVSVILFFTELLRVDLIALLVMGSLALTGVLSPADALSGFSNPAVITVWAMFIISGGLTRTGVANIIGNRVLGLAGNTELRLLITIMLTAGILSAFMNNVGVAALLLPVVMDIARRTKIQPSKLLMPLAVGCLLGGMLTLIGTPPNILVSEALRGFGLEPFNFFDFTPVGVTVLVLGTAFTVVIGRLLLPKRYAAREARETGLEEIEAVYDLSQDIYVLNVPGESVLAGKSLAESRFGTVLDISVIGIIRAGKTILAPEIGEVLQTGDQLVVTGEMDQFYELQGRQNLVIEADQISLDDLISENISIAEIAITPESDLLSRTLKQVDFRRKFQLVVLAILREDQPIRSNLDNLPLKSGDRLLVQGENEKITRIIAEPDFIQIERLESELFRLQERLMVVCIPGESYLVGRPISESRLGESIGVAVLGIVRGGETILQPEADELLQADDILFVRGREENLTLLRGLQELNVEDQIVPDIEILESDQVSVVEGLLSPHTTLNGKTLRQIHFREKYGLNVLAILREGKTHRSQLRDMALRFGDALLLFGRRERLKMLGSEPDFLLLTEEVQEAPHIRQAPIAILILAGIVLSVIAGWLPISIAGVIGAALMVLSGSLTMEEAYRYIDWRAVFLIAGMLPLGIAMETTGAANFIATSVISRIGTFGILAVIAGVFILTNVTSQVMPNAVVAVLMAPIAYNAAVDLGISPYTMMMVVAIAASASFMSPVGHPANVLVMGPGGYRFSDYIKLGFPLTILVLLITLLILPIFWPY